MSIGTITLTVNKRNETYADVIRGESIRLYGKMFGKPFSIKFNVGDVAIYDSYNLIYLGTIIQITEKCVTIKPRYSNRVKRLKLAVFASKNYDFNLERVERHNREMSIMI